MNGKADKKIHIFTGHFGSGKTEIALNFAVKYAKQGIKTAIADMDIVNPYFRTADARSILDKYKIDTVASEFASANVDIPILPSGLSRIFSDNTDIGIIDVGGDGDGAYVLGTCRREIERCGYNMYFVVNTKRPLTGTCGDVREYINEIEAASGLNVTHIINNTNLGKCTTADTLMSGREVVKEVSKKTGIPIAFESGTQKVISEISEQEKKDNTEKFEMKIFLAMPWEKRKER